MKTNTRRLTAILVPLALLAGGVSYSLVSSNKPTLTPTTDKSQIVKVSTVSQTTAPVAKPSATPSSVKSKSNVIVKKTAPSVTPVSVAITKAVVKKPASKKPVIKVTVPKGSTIATRTGSGIQTVTVNTSKVAVSVNPVSTPAPSASPSQGSPISPIDGRTLIQSAPDWSGFIAPKVSFAGVLSCKKSTVLMQSWFTGKMDYPYLVTERWKFTGGNFVVGDSTTRYTPSDTYYVTFTDEAFFTNNMNMTSTRSDSFIFNPFNWTPGSAWADGTADTMRNISYDVSSTYKQSECQ